MNSTVIAIDGPAASGKGTLGRRLAETLDFAYLDTGKLYRGVAFLYSTADTKGKNDALVIEECITRLTPDILNDPRLLNLEIAELSSSLAVRAEVRQGLLGWQRAFCHQPPDNKCGAILDGRDIGTIIAPNALVKFYLEASDTVRAKRRHNETLDRGEKSNYESVLAYVRQRDNRDRTRALAPAIAAKDAIVIDTDYVDIETIFRTCLELVRKRMSEQS